ncbi:MAG: cysteine synthase A [Magnetococcales bacterium]|nr:cysteine synthase A [Magnetococcales bacterium]
MSKLYANITETIGATPLVRLNRIVAGLEGTFLAKLESFNPMASVKDRIGLAMVEAAEAEGRLNSESLIIEPTSGNTGIALAMVCASRGYRLMLVMPESMSVERRRMFRLLGAEVVLTPAVDGMRGAVLTARSILEREPNGVMLDQFENPANPEVHARTTAREILAATDGAVDVLVAGVGTGGTLTGVARTLKQQIPALRAVAVEPLGSPVLGGGMPGPHRIQGIGAGFVPRVLDRRLVDEVVAVGDEAAIATARRLAAQEGIACGISSGAAVAAVLELAERPDYRGRRFVIILPDFAERYLSTELFADL